MCNESDLSLYHRNKSDIHIYLLIYLFIYLFIYHINKKKENSRESLTGLHDINDEDSHSREFANFYARAWTYEVRKLLR